MNGQVQNILMVYPVRDDGFPSFTPLGLCSIGTMLSEKGYKVKVIDMRWHRQEELERNAKNADLIGIGPVHTIEAHRALRIAQFCKSINENAKVILGGPHPTIFPRWCLSSSQVDYAILGEGEFTILDLAEGKKESEISGLAFKRHNQILINKRKDFIEDLNVLPIPNRDLFPIKDMLEAVPSSPCLTPYPYMNMISSRGCPYNCIFCQPTLRILFGAKVRRRSPKKVVDEFEFLIDKYNPAAICMMDDLFVTDEKWVLGVCREIRERKLVDRTVWECESRANTFNQKIALELKKSGCFRVWFGMESFCQKTLNTLRKGTTVEQNKSAIRTCQKVGLIPLVQIMIGNPWETYSDLVETVNGVKETDPEIIWVTNTSPIPGTDLYQMCRREKLLLAKSFEEFDRSLTSKPKIKLPEEFNIYTNTIAELERTFLNPKYFTRSYYRRAYGRRLNSHIRARHLSELLFDLGAFVSCSLRPIIGRKPARRLLEFGHNLRLRRRRLIGLIDENSERPPK